MGARSHAASRLGAALPQVRGRASCGACAPSMNTTRLGPTIISPAAHVTESDRVRTPLSPPGSARARRASGRRGQAHPRSRAASGPLRCRDAWRSQPRCLRGRGGVSAARPAAAHGSHPRWRQTACDQAGRWSLCNAHTMTRHVRSRHVCSFNGQAACAHACTHVQAEQLQHVVGHHALPAARDRARLRARRTVGVRRSLAGSGARAPAARARRRPPGSGAQAPVAHARQRPASARL